jgi:peptide-methionine (S)-S-oxide reductase
LFPKAWQGHIGTEPSQDEGHPMTERAVLAGGCFWGMQDLIRRYDGVISTRVGYSGGDVPNATYRNHGTHAEAIEIVFDPAGSATAAARVLLPDPRPDDTQPPGQRRRRELPLGDLLHERRAEACRAGHHRRCRRLRPLARQGRDRSGAGGRLLGGRAGAPGLPGAIPNGYTCHFIRPNWKLPSEIRASAAE